MAAQGWTTRIPVASKMTKSIRNKKGKGKKKKSEAKFKPQSKN